MVTEIKRAINTEWERLRRTDRSRATLKDSRQRVSDAASLLSTGTEGRGNAASSAPETITPGARVRAEHLGVQGEVVAITGATATVQSGTITVRVPLQALRLATAAGGLTPPRRDGRITLPAKAAPNSELHLIGRTTDEARSLVEQYLDDAFLAGLGRVRFVHGKGTGALRKAVRDLLTGHPLVDSFRDGEPAEGGSGATVAALKVS
jgi:DNA mismatch repair protein MutS2